MKALFVLCAIAAFSPSVGAESEFSGVIESTVSSSLSASDEWSYVLEEFANLRFKARAGERMTVQGAVNAHADSSSLGASSTGGELERLYCGVRGERADFDVGLMRIAFGYGLAFRPTDFIDRPNPLYPDARPEGSLAALVAWFPGSASKVEVFAAERKDSGASARKSPVCGISADWHASRVSLEPLLAVEAPIASGERAVIRSGLSAKLDAGAGFVLDALYTAGPENAQFFEGLEASLGADWSFHDGDWYVAGQYFFNGSGVLGSGDSLADLYGDPLWYDIPTEARTASDGSTEYHYRHYAYLSVLWNADDYTRFSLSCVACLADLSAIPAFLAEHEPFQGMTVSLRARLPLDGRTFGLSRYGELGSENANYRGSLSLCARFRF